MAEPIFTNLFVALTLVATGCGDDSSSETGGGNGDGWDGEDPHMRATGEIGGKVVEIDSTDGLCERNYQVPNMVDPSTYGDGYLEKIEIKLDFLYEGEPAEFQVEFADLNYTVAAAPLRGIEVGGAEADAANTTDINVTAQLEVNPDAPNEEEFEEDRVSGTFAVELLAGGRAATGSSCPMEKAGSTVASMPRSATVSSRCRSRWTGGDNDIETAE